VGAAVGPDGVAKRNKIVLGAFLLVAAGTRWVIGVAPLVCFWLLLLGGIAIAVVAMWSMLYRPDTARSPVSS